MSFQFVYGLLLLCILNVYSDEITTLPGWTGKLPSKQYSGYIDIPNTAPNTRHYHYWFVESENDPENDPIVFWFNGGPGASSLLGYFTELGPFHVYDESIQDNTTEIPLLYYNNYTWSKVCNIIFIESPAGVGFSYCEGNNGPINSCPDWNDTLVAQDNHKVLQGFFKLFPKYLNNPFYITGESYAGIYVPTLVMQVDNDPSGMPPLLGFAVGDGCMGIGGYGGCNKDSQAIFWNFMYGHGQCSTAAYEQIVNTCGNSIYFGNETLRCYELLAELYVDLGGFNIYNIYDECYLENDELRNEFLSKPQIFKNKDGHTRFNARIGYNGRIQSGINQYSCGSETVTNIYLNIDTVKKAIFVADIPWTWQDGNWNKYHSTQTDLRPFYQTAVKKYRVLIYYGDADAGVPYLGGEEWTSNLGYNILEKWRPWTVDGEMDMGGYVQTYNTGNNFTFLTVRGAGMIILFIYQII